MVETVTLSVRIPKELDDKLKRLQKRGGTKTEVVEDALRRYVEVNDAAFSHNKVMAMREVAFGAERLEERRHDIQRLSGTTLLPALESDPSATQTNAGRFLKQGVFDALLALWRDPAGFSINHLQQSIDVVSFSYPPRKEYKRGLAHVDPATPSEGSYAQELQEHVSRAFLRCVAGTSIKGGEDRYFDVAARPELALRPRIFSFAFYLTRERRHHYGVLPYGWHRRFGLVIHEALLDEIARTLEVEVSELKESVKNDANYVVTFLNELLTKIDQASNTGKESFIYSVDGFIHDEVAADLIYGRALVNLRPVFTKRCRKFIPEEAQQIGKEIATRLGSATHSVVLLDNIYSQVALPNGFRLLEISHGLKIPVGIGYTLTALPKLMSEGWIGNLYGSLDVFFRQHDSELSAITAEFDSQGVELDSNLRDYSQPKDES